MKTNTVKTKLAAGGISIGTMVFEFNTTGIGRIAASAGAEFIIFDSEHTGWSVETLRMLIATSQSADTLPFVRVPATQYHLLSRPLDVGAMGLMVPMVEDAAQAKVIVHSSKYHPIGGRGTGFGLSHDDFIGGDVGPKMERANRETFLIAQIETGKGVENADEIAAVEGIDCLWVGHFDLSQSLGIPGQFDHPRFLKAIDHVLDVCRARGKAPGILAGSVDVANAWIDRGFRAVAYGGDLWVYQQALTEGIGAIENHVARKK